MTQENKELLLRDLCSRLPYGLVIDFNGIKTTLHSIKVFQLYNGDVIKDYICLIDIFGDDDYIDVEKIKPYLFPFSSMTEEQKEELKTLGWNFDNSEIHNVSEFLGTYREYVSHLDCFILIGWFNKNHIDYRGLIEKGLAINATNKNIY